MSRKSRPSRVPVAVAIAGAALLLSGCAPVRSGAAAIVGGTRITVASVQQAARQLAAAGGSTGKGAVCDQQVQLNRKVLLQITDDLAASRGITVTNGEVDAKLASLVSQAGGQAALQASAVSSYIPPEGIHDAVRLIVLSDKLATAIAPGAAAADASAKVSAALQAFAKVDKVTLNPRYGSWDYATGSPVIAGSGGLATAVGPDPLGCPTA